MKKCPTCEKTFDDGMRFCQVDGTPLVEIADKEPQDLYKTTVGKANEISSAIPVDPFKTMVAPPPKKDEKEILELPEEPDFLKTMVSHPKEQKKSELPIENRPEIKNQTPPSSPFGDATPSNIDSGDKITSYGGESSPPQQSVPQPDTGYTPNEQSFSNQTEYENPSSPPIPSPFEESMIGYQAPLKPNPPFDEPDQPTQPRSHNPFDQPVSPLQEAEIKAEAFNTPYADQVENQFNQPLEKSNWTPPPAPDASWQNQQIGQNTPFQPPASGVQGENKTLAVVSLVLGILSIPCCGFVLFGIGAVVTGFMAKSKAEQNPNEYGGKSLALGGIIIGGITIVIGIILNIVYLFIGLPMHL